MKKKYRYSTHAKRKLTYIYRDDNREDLIGSVWKNTSGAGWHFDAYGNNDKGYTAGWRLWRWWAIAAAKRIAD